MTDLPPTRPEVGPRAVPERRAVRAALRTVLSDRQAKALLRHGWRGLVSEAEAEVEELREQLAEIHVRFSKSIERE